jgi:molecular chaperone DnaK
VTQSVGIDLGTTYSAVAQVQGGTPRILAQGDERIMPSVVGVTPQGGILVGTPARNQYVLYPERTARSIKRRMGQTTQVTLGEQAFTPPEVSALILKELKRRAEAQLGQPVERAVITVPAYFSDAARQATREAGELAGFSVERIINEPTAAALAYGLDRGNERQIIAVYDLGGGTFDVSIIELDSGVVEVRASHGNTALGGDDFDQRLVDVLARRFEEVHGVDPRTDRRALARLVRAAEAAKIALSTHPFARVREEYLLTKDGHPLHLDVELTRGEFEDLILDLLEGTITSFDTALKDAGITANDLSRILLVGGSTRIPLVSRLVAERAGLAPEIAVDPDEAVALGAAVQAAIIAGEPLDAILVDLTPHSLGIEVAEWQFGEFVPGRYSVIIPRNTTIPTSRSEVYTAITPQQEAIEIKIYQGESSLAARNTLLGEFLFDHLRPEAPGLAPRITVQFDFDLDGIVQVSAVDRGSGKQARSQVTSAHAHMSPAEIERVRADLDALEWGDVDEEDEEDGGAAALETGEAAATGNGTNAAANALLTRARAASERGVEEAGALRSAMLALQGALFSGDLTAIEQRSEELLNLLYELDDA